MKILAPADIKKLLAHAPLDKAARLNREKRVYNLKPRGEGWAACVLADSGLPALAWAHDDGKRLHWDCDCASAEPCLHLWALLVRLQQDEHLYQTVLRSALSAAGQPPSARRAAIAAGQGENLDLFDEGLWQPSLFDDEVPLSPSAGLAAAVPGDQAGKARGGHRAGAESAVHHPAAGPDLFESAALPPGPAGEAPARRDPAAPAPPRPGERPQLTVFLLRLQAMNRPDLWVEKLSLNLSASQAAALQAALGHHDCGGLEQAIQHLARRVEHSPEHQLSLGSAIGDLLAVATALAALPASPLPRLSFITPNRHLACREISHVTLRPVLVRTTAEGKGRYQIECELMAGDQAVASVPAAALASEGSLVYAVPKGTDTLCWRRDDAPLASLVARIRAMGGPVSALDLEQLRQWMAQRGVASASLPAAGNERFVHRTVSPRPVVSLQAGLHRVELFLSFAYDGKEVAFHAETENLSRELGDGLTVVMPRQKAEESRWHHQLRDLLSDCTQYERGLYAEMIGARSVPDISVETEISGFLTERGRELIAAGYDLRMEGRPVSAAGSLSFRAESGLDWFGFRAGWKDAGRDGGSGDAAVALDGRRESGDPWELQGGGRGAGTLDLVVDEHLDTYGIAGAKDSQGSERWIILGQRDIDRLKLLRNLGMDSGGLLETSPVNLSLIDSLYADIENKDEEHVARSRQLTQGLAGFSVQAGGDGTGATPPAGADAGAPEGAANGLLPQPAGLRTTLRHYQQVGYSWLGFLHEQGLGGCLADDMGLGKTVQTIALLQRLKKDGRLGPSLLIAPVVTLPNWEDELARFAPALRFRRHAGADRARTLAEMLGGPEAAEGDGQIPPRSLAAAGHPGPAGAGRPEAELPMGGVSGRGAAGAADPVGLTPPGCMGEQDPQGPTSPAPGAADIDLILVSYQTLRNDLDLFVQQDWDYAILDEAHYIKNAGSQIFKAIRVLPAAHRLSLTGTPIENSTMELWAQFSFLNPGLLGSRRRFLSEVALPIERDADEAALAALRDTIAPFILRRRKQDVLADLPPKDEILNWCEMAPDQARLYEEHCALYRDQIAGVLDSKGVEGSRMDIFRALLRLRQIAINPAMIKHAPRDSYGDPDADLSAASPYGHYSSAKMESLRMLMDESLQEDHKMLVFSQFVSALKLISGELERGGRRHALLTGQTTDRRTMVRDFQTDEDLRIFLLSLKAGGVGINLTSADYVVLFDPWWNPAAERQAVDRAHRIGQKRPVIVYKFITRGTIEEKILALQHKKHRLAGSLLAGDEGEDGFLSGLDEAAVMELFR